MTKLLSSILFLSFSILTVTSVSLFDGSDSSSDWVQKLSPLAPHGRALKAWLDSAMLDGKPFNENRPRHDILTCEVCMGAYPIMEASLKNGSSVNQVMDEIINLCFVLGYYSETTCRNLVHAEAPPLIYTIMNIPERTKEDVCGIINAGCAEINPELIDWHIQIDENKPPIQNLPLLPNDLELSNILQFTDLHVDTHYVAGSNAAGGCRGGVPESEEDVAGPFGDSRCDLPLRAVESMAHHAKTAHEKVKYIFVTGDFMHNSLWEYSQQENSLTINAVTEIFLKEFPDVPIYPLTGNHDAQIINMYPPHELWSGSPDLDLLWLYNVVADPFAKWLGPEQLATFKKGGYYSVTPEPGLRLVVLNTNLCYLNNFWLVYDPIDPAGQLQWFADTMYQAELDGVNVFLLGHISPGSFDCWPVWSSEFNRVVNRFENSIRGQFYGHEHPEYFKLTFENATERAITVSHVAPSSLSDVGKSSAYKVYKVDGERGLESTWEIADHETWILNTTLSNALNVSFIKQLYSAKETYGLESLRGSDWYNLVLKMLIDNDLFVQFQLNINKGLTDGESYGPDCDPSRENFNECRLSVLCYCVTANPGDQFNCKKLEEISRNFETTKKLIRETVQN